MRPLTLLVAPILGLATTAIPTGMPAVGAHAPAFSLPVSGGGTHSLAEVARKKDLVLVFFRGVW